MPGAHVAVTNCIFVMLRDSHNLLRGTKIKPAERDFLLGEIDTLREQVQVRVEPEVESIFREVPAMTIEQPTTKVPQRSVEVPFTGRRKVFLEEAAKFKRIGTDPSISLHRRNAAAAMADIHAAEAAKETDEPIYTFEPVSREAPVGWAS